MKNDYKAYKVGDLVRSLGSKHKTYGIVITLPPSPDCPDDGKMPENFYKVLWDKGYGAFWTHTETFVLVSEA